jgi:hypothetical protein
MELSTLQKEYEMTDIIKDGLKAQAFVADLNRQAQEKALLDYPEDQYYTPYEPPEVSDATVERLNDLMPTVD